MYAPTHVPLDDWTHLFRWFGRATGGILFTAWATLVVLEFMRPSGVAPKPEYLSFQALALGMVFGGYVIGWRREFAGGVMVLTGIVAYWAVNFFQLGYSPVTETALFAAPGLFYLLAYICQRREQAPPRVS